MSSSVDSSMATGLLAGFSTLMEGVVHDIELSALSLFIASFLIWNVAKAKLRPSPRAEIQAEKRATAEKTNKAMKSPVAQRTWKQQIPAPDKNEPDKELVASTVQMDEKQMCEFLRQKEFTRALHLFRSLERDGREQYLSKEDLFSSFVQSAIRVEKFDVVEKMLRLAKRNSVEFTLRSWKSILKVLSAKKRFDTCQLVYAIFEEDVPVDQVVFSCLINAALESNRKADAAKMLRRYRDADVSPADFVLCFRTYAALGDVDSAEALFQEVRGAMTSLMLNLLLNTCVNATQTDRAERCLQLGHHFEQETGKKIVNVVSYNTTMKGFAQEGFIGRCFECFEQLLQHGLEPDDATVGMLVDTCLPDVSKGAQDRRRAFREKIMDLWKQPGVQKSTMMCTHFLKFLVKTDCIEDAARLYEDMKSSEQTRPDVITCSMLIKAHVNSHDMDRAIYVVDDMVAGGCLPDDMILSCLLEGCREAGLSDLGCNLFDRFVKMAVIPSGYSILTLLKLLGSDGKHKAAHELVADCGNRFGTRPSVIHYTCLMSGALLSKDYEQAWKAYVLMQRQGVKPDATAVSTLLPGLVAAQCWERLLELLDASIKASPPINIRAEMLNNALSQMLVGGAPKQHVLRLQVLMQGMGAPITVRNAQRLS